ncbi:sensor histidine kinase [Kurthia sibirica]|uniref:histidine kinase n=1 Tax=Kurthia sibirica TaxID=202750 RepID=A0A2U3AN64_9BACL|nr:sensor histidine kinase [Kurthia sibirica]PWI25972.1 sensor histidine kinase [Kurthia sibirica]GEK34995.1 sensor histidine kinase DesK [Kurthia sibirica]
MSNWYAIIPKHPIYSILGWIFICFIPYYIIFKNQSFTVQSIAAAVLITYLICVYMDFSQPGRLSYMWLSFEMIINAVMAILFGYFYFALFTAFLIGRIRNKVGFFIMYGFHIAITVGSILSGFFIETELYIQQIPFMVVVVFGVILAPFYLFSRTQSDQLELKLKSAESRIHELSIVEERQRIARDLHDTLGQKLSMIGLKLDLAIRLVDKDKEQAKLELGDIRKVSSMALKEVREMVSDMKKIKIEDELLHVQEILEVANIDLKLKGKIKLDSVPLILENTLSMCLKEAVNNIVRHSKATKCYIRIEQTAKEIRMTIADDGIGYNVNDKHYGNGIKGIMERIQFVNGQVQFESTKGFTIKIIVPLVIVYHEDNGKSLL